MTHAENYVQHPVRLGSILSSSSYIQPYLYNQWLTKTKFNNKYNLFICNFEISFVLSRKTCSIINIKCYSKLKPMNISHTECAVVLGQGSNCFRWRGRYRFEVEGFVSRSNPEQWPVTLPQFFDCHKGNIVCYRSEYPKQDMYSLLESQKIESGTEDSRNDKEW